MKTIVISAVNLVNGGTLSILLSCLESLSHSELINEYKVIALVHNRSMMHEYEGIEYIEYPKAKKNYLFRLYYEYVAFMSLSKKLKPYLWLSLHDMSPRVIADKQAVYMHNPTPFYNPKARDWKYVPINALWAYLYKYLYKINIHSNNYLIVQQQWIRDAFSQMFSFSSEKIIVARPINERKEAYKERNVNRDAKGTIFIYPAYPRVFKNFEVLCDAARILDNKGIKDISIILTIDGTENKYSKYLVEKYGDVGILDFHGLVPNKEMERMYKESSCLVFPSKLETWGLPLSEYKPYNKPILVADLPYSHESVAGASKVRFFDPDNPRKLADAMMDVINDESSSFNVVPELELKVPYSESWEELFRILLR